MNFLTQYQGLPRQVYLLSASRALISMGMMFVYPFLSLLLTSRLGYTEINASYIIVTASVASILGTLTGGKLSDEIGRKKVFYCCVGNHYCIHDSGRILLHYPCSHPLYHHHVFYRKHNHAGSIGNDS